MTVVRPARALPAALEGRRRGIEAALAGVLPREGSEPRALVAAMRYSVLGGGKRFRPLLFFAGAEAGPERLPEDAVDAAAALELLHTYSLIHDDLPCMDDDDLRRGQPTCHVKFGEATALLAGDALQTLGVELLATRPAGEEWAARRALAVAKTARAIGVEGMAGGQALDLAATGTPVPPEERPQRLKTIHALKTGRLIRLSVELGALHAGADAGDARGDRALRRRDRASLPDRRRSPRRHPGFRDARQDRGQGRGPGQADVPGRVRPRGRAPRARPRARRGPHGGRGRRGGGRAPGVSRRIRRRPGPLRAGSVTVPG